MIVQDPDVLLCGRVVAKVVGDFDSAPPRSRHIADEAMLRSLAMDLVTKDLVAKDLVGKDSVGEDLIGKDLIGKDLESR
jgi:hypothetical protein